MLARPKSSPPVSERRMQDIELAEVSQPVSKPFHNRPLLSKGRRSQLRVLAVRKLQRSRHT
jgi:hypothetical protein